MVSHGLVSADKTYLDTQLRSKGKFDCGHVTSVREDFEVRIGYQGEEFRLISLSQEQMMVLDEFKSDVNCSVFY